GLDFNRADQAPECKRKLVQKPSVEREGIRAASVVKAEKMDSPAKAALTDYLAAERTFLAWIRTGLALMGFGFVVARFGFFLQELRIAQHIPSPPSYGLSTWFGTALVVLGVIVNVASGWHHARLLGRLDRGEVARPGSSKLVVAFALLLALLGLGMAIYLIS